MKTRVIGLEVISVGDIVICVSSMPHLHNNIKDGQTLTVVDIGTDGEGDFAKLKDDERYYYVTLGDLYLNFEHVNLV